MGEEKGKANKNKRKIGKRGQVTLPKEIREELNLKDGDEISIHEKNGKIIIEKPISREDLAEGYRRRSERAKKIQEEMKHTSKEVNKHLDDPPEW